MCEQTWTVIQFEQDCSVEAVPSTWIQGQFCYWPTYSRDKITSAIRKHESLNTCWPSYKIRNFRNSTFDNYSKARSKAHIAEFTSDLNSEVETNTKRKVYKKILTSSSSEENLIPQPPKLKTKVKMGKKINSVRKESSEKSINVDQYEISNTEIDNSILDENVDFLNYERELISTPRNSPYSHLSKREKFDEKTVKNLVAQNYLIRSVVLDILSEVKEIKLQLKNNSQEINTRGKEQIISVFNNKDNDINFPLKTEEELQIVEAVLENDDEITKAMTELQQLGGNNGYEFIRRCLSMILTNEIADKYSFFGRKKKKAFCNLNICKDDETRDDNDDDTKSRRIVTSRSPYSTTTIQSA
ncbi:uncharacterized protein LOC114941881 [Nylanderia fulva]|uniref:uncharacterized protein LOC114941881 n=1 Tax=Nylanderia fulva TaxID=613905 RepID=UPI0010FAFD83|nr:uncharacterized protein LOC114941881 [Nylanderia fulva]